MAIFNSLGSNYDFKYVLKALLTKGSKLDIERLKKLLEEKYRGKALLFYKGREALTATLKILNLPQNSNVAINGFTCVAVFNAIRTAGIEPICLDLEETGGLNFTAKTLEQSIKKNKKIKVVIVQNTFGYPCEIEGIKKICEKNNLILIEDLAHCVGTKYENGQEAGTVGDFVVLSFSQDKIIDAVSGGALVIRNKKFYNFGNIFNVKRPPNQTRDRHYPQLTYKIRHLYGLIVGKFYHYILKQLKFMSDIMNETYYEYYSLPNLNAHLALYQFAILEEQLAHRKKIANIYIELLPEDMFMYSKKKTQDAVSLSSNLRFPIFIESRQNLINHLKEHGIYLSDIWYTDVAPNCPNAVADSKIIVNLPTHINVLPKTAERICKLINQWKQK